MQAHLFADLCPCLERSKEIGGLCRSCYASHYRSRSFFGGNRERVLERDQQRCRACGNMDQIVVHHRTPGVHTAERLITLCAGCHARVHRSFMLRNWVPALVFKLWREQHPRSPLQLQLALGAEPPLPNAKSLLMSYGTLVRVLTV